MKHILFLATATVFASGAFANGLLIDDFSVSGTSALGTQWQAFTDGVMGGRSQMDAGYARDGESAVLRMTGTVSLENNGGFIQVRLPLSQDGAFDASEYGGIAVEARGTPGSYFIHARTRATRLPWQVYKAQLPINAEWQRIVIPFDVFAPDSIRGALDSSRLTSIAVAAAGQAFDGDISIRRIEFVR